MRRPPRKTHRHRRLIAGRLTCALLAPVAQAQEDLFELSLGDLLNLEVTSVSKKSQPISQAAAAVFVITAEDIRRAGVTTIPEALRMAPGMEVAQVDANKWAISARGAQGRFANKLLVLIDGRSTYSPLFSGVFWDVQDTLLEDVARIEVVRGPGATLWGANAVNGVINIITRSAAESSGGLLVAGLGDQEKGYAGLRFGGNLGSSGHYRVYAKHFNRNGNQQADTGRDASDKWDQQRVGFRADVTTSTGATITVQGDAYRGDSGSETESLSLVQPFQFSGEEEQEVFGYNVLSRWESAVAGQDQISIQAFIDRSRRDWSVADFDRTTFDLDLDYRTERFDRHDVLFGFNYRITRDRTLSSFRVAIDPVSRDEELMGAFLQDEWTLIPDQLSLIAGMKIELNDYTGYEYQPNIRVLWRPSPRTSYWASMTRAVRTPGRAERDSRVLSAVLPSGPAGGPPTGVFAVGNRDFQAEELHSYEAGFKFEVSDSFAWDVAMYFSDYDEIRATSPIGNGCFPAGELPICLADPNTLAVRVDVQQNNEGQVDAFGIEWAANWQASSHWQIKAAYSYIDEEASASAGSSVTELQGREPRHHFSVRSSHQLTRTVDADFWLRYADSVALTREVIDAYTNLDARIAWRPVNGTELSLNARNLVGSSRVEFESELGDLRPIEIEPSVHLQLTLAF
ncbi:MAG: TonB-dependent receptor plug domain-containing protein [Congregibacter sp.]